MKIKPSKNILILPIVLFFINASKAQLAEHPLIANTSVVFGVSFSKMLTDSIYDEDLGRVNYGLYYNTLLSNKIDLDVGAMFTQKGGKSFQEDTYQTFAYVSFPIKANYVFSDKFKMGLGAEVSYLAFNNTKKRGVRSIMDPNPHPYEPKNTDLALVTSIDMGIAPNADLSILGSYSLASSSNPDTKLNLGTIALQLRVGIGSSIKQVENLAFEARQTDIEFVKLRSGYTLVCLNGRKRTAQYYLENGDTAQSETILKDAAIKNKSLRAAFKEHYTYSKVLFLDNVDLAKACNGDKNVVLEDADGEKVSVKVLDDAFFVFFKPGSIYTNVASFNKSGYEFLNTNCLMLKDPFPAYDVGFTTSYEDMNKLVKDLNKRMLSRERDIREKSYFTEDLLNQ